MKSRPRALWARLLGILFLAALLGLSGEGLAGVPRVRGDWVEAESSTIGLYSNAGEGRTRELALGLERFRLALTEFLPGFIGDASRPTRVFVFRNSSSFSRYRAFLGAPREIDALFAATPQCHYMLLRAGRDSSPLALLYHETLHQVVAESSVPEIPLWLNEGLAEFFSTFWSDATHAEIGLPNPDYLYRLRGETDLDLPHLLDVAPRSPDYFEPGAKSLFHARAWLLVHYLISSDVDFSQLIPRYMTRIQDSKAPLDAFCGALGVPPAELEAAIRQHLAQKPLPTRRIALSPSREAAAPTLRPMSRADVLLRLGEFLAMACRDCSEDAERHFRSALQADDEHLPSMAAMGALLTRLDREEEAAPFLARACGLSGDDGSLHYLEGCRLLHPHTDALEDLGGKRASCPDSILDARAAFLRSITLLPSSPKGYLGAAKTCLWSSAANADCKRIFASARHRFPGHGELACYHVVYLLRLGDLTGARERVLELRRALPGNPWTRRAIELLPAEEAVTDPESGPG